MLLSNIFLLLWEAQRSSGHGTKVVELHKRVYMQRQHCKKDSETSTFALDFKKYKRIKDCPKQFWDVLGFPSSGLETSSCDLVFLFVALKNRIQTIYVAIDGTGLGADQKLTEADLAKQFVCQIFYIYSYKRYCKQPER